MKTAGLLRALAAACLATTAAAQADATNNGMLRGNGLAAQAAPAVPPTPAMPAGTTKPNATAPAVPATPAVPAGATKPNATAPATPKPPAPTAAPTAPTAPAAPKANATAPATPAVPAIPAAAAPNATAPAAAPAVPATPAVPAVPQTPAPAQAETKKGPNGLKLKQLINCFAWYLPEAAHRADNSKVQGCDESTIVYCRTDSGNNDHFCRFDGTNFLQDAWDANPACFFNCQMETCNSWGNPSTDAQKKCVGDLWN